MASQLSDVPDHAWLGVPIDARSLFAPEHTALMGTMRGLAPADWGAEAVPGWTVRDLAAHVLGDYYGRLARDRDGHREGPVFGPGETLEAFIHRINQEWVDAFSRVSPAALTDTLDVIGGQNARFFEAADLASPSLGVSWAGIDPAPMWLDCARDFTEYWTHRQQIRHATGQDTDHDPRLLAVVLDTFMRALPHTLREVDAPVGTQIQMRIGGPAGGTWTVTATESRWSLAEPDGGRPAATVHLDAETVWRLCTRGIQPADALTHARINGRRDLAEAACQIVSIIY
ncbi:maleylpyruvate isomerase family mycothiol-dependent enzyme [Actinomadura sp. 7K507]|uniref:maleylpyruvate isomerase family mycothiol-dependent enzyme n=1 Tax=Actinomadura sp. 7K507 TaxID=2530365 RepID=UPI0010432C3B|nr:maleylpyruvate isomerase family mycothiol-dependent enzyme [Actinomadura sp. 7K507]TDC91060.1 maleylpyruvate isomerase family mycothiol-dependent enzyme [Actinomadura sp. 7K507]